MSEGVCDLGQDENVARSPFAREFLQMMDL